MLFAMLMATISVDSIASSNALQAQSTSANSFSFSTANISSVESTPTPFSSAQPNVEHHCCGSVCLLKMPPLIVSESFEPQIESLALIEKEPSHKAIVAPQAPYRPPIS